MSKNEKKAKNNVVLLNTSNTFDAADDVLDSWKGRLAKVMVIGEGADGQLCYSTNMTREYAFYLVEMFKGHEMRFVFEGGD